MSWLRNTLTVFVCILLAAYSALMIIPKVCGYKLYAVTSGSMGTTIPEGSLVAAKPVSYEEIAVGDVIVFTDTDEQRSFTHRVVSKYDDEQLLFTRGDANTADDPTPTEFKYCAGRMVFHISGLGFVSIVMNSYLKWPIAAAILLIFVVSEIIIAGRKRKKCREEE